MKHSHSNRGFTLYELVVAIGASAALLIGLGAILTVSVRALPTDSDGLREATEFARAYELLAADLTNASRIREVGDGTIEFDVHDETYADAGTIRWSWNGSTPGYLHRTMTSGGSAPAIRIPVDNVDFTSELRRMTVVEAPVPEVTVTPGVVISESTESVSVGISNFESLGLNNGDVSSAADGAVRVVPTADVHSLSVSPSLITGSVQILQEVTPAATYSSGAWGVSMVSIDLLATSSNAPNWLHISVRLLDEWGEPTTVVLGWATIGPRELGTTSITTVEIPIPGGAQLEPDDRVGVMLYLENDSLPAPATAEAYTFTDPVQGYELQARTDDTSPWVTMSGTQLDFTLVGDIEPPLDEETTVTTRAASIDMSITFSESGRTREATIPLPWPVEATP
ncbi:MAG: type II secretion system protein [Planctomycetota bacterium]